MAIIYSTRFHFLNRDNNRFSFLCVGPVEGEGGVYAGACGLFTYDISPYPFCLLCGHFALSLFSPSQKNGYTYSYNKTDKKLKHEADQQGLYWDRLYQTFWSGSRVDMRDKYQGYYLIASKTALKPLVRQVVDVCAPPWSGFKAYHTEPTYVTFSASRHTAGKSLYSAVIDMFHPYAM